MLDLTEQDASEIFYALDSKRLAIIDGFYGDKDSDVSPQAWAEHLDEIMSKIGSDGEELIKALSVDDTAVRLLRSAIDRWPEIGSEKSINGAECVDWLADFLRDARRILSEGSK